MSDDFFDLNDAEPQHGGVIPPGVYRLRAMVKPGGVVNPLCPAKNQRTKHLELDLTVVGGEHDGSKLRDYITLKFDDARYDDGDILLPPPVSPEQAEKYRTAVRLGRSK